MKDIRIWLSLGELQLVDWCICGYSHVLPDGLDDLIELWGPLRRKVWGAILTPECQSKGPETPVYLDESDCRVLLALLPTTFRWGGVGNDVGWDLKNKIAMWERGQYDHNASDQASSEASDAASNKADDSA